MKNVQKIGGYAALVWSVIFLWAVLHLTIILASQGFSSPEELGDPSKGIHYLSHTIYPVIENYLTLLYALVAALVVLALHTRLKEQLPNVMNFATGFGLFTAGLNVVEGVTGFFGQSAVLGLHATDQAAAEIAYVALATMHDALLFAGIFTLGLWSVSAHWAALKAKSLPKWVCYLGLFTGLQAIFAIFLPPLSLPVLHIVWAFGLGLSLLRSTE